MGSELIFSLCLCAFVVDFPIVSSWLLFQCPTLQ